jgi:selenocysteine lyase/cysteine desulfurase
MTENYFKSFRDQIVGIDQEFPTPFGTKKMLYADWIASGRLYHPIEKKLQETIFPFCGNTHTETSITGTLMTKAYHQAKEYIKQEVNANENDALIFAGSGMTAVVNKLQRILGLRFPERCKSFTTNEDKRFDVEEKNRPVVFITHMEHHSNQTSWLETIADVEIIMPDKDGLVDLQHFDTLLHQYKNRPLKIASVTASSNVTGICTPYYQIAERIHAEDGFCFVDFACSGPYVHIDMHPEKLSQQLDVIFISPHKFLGGPGTPGIMVMNKSLYKNAVPDNSGGGTVRFTTPWKTHEYFDSIEDREDGGTPPFLQGIKAALCFKLKKEMGVANIEHREKQLVPRAMHRLRNIDGIKVLAENIIERIGCISFYYEKVHFNLAVRILNDYFGIQVRGGCACAGTYGHYLLQIDRETSDKIYKGILDGNLKMRPGWVRLSIHPTITDAELDFILDAIDYLAKNETELS